MAGLPRKYAKMGFKKGWAAFRGNKTGSTRSIRRGASMAKRKGSRRSSGSGGKMMTGLYKPSGMLGNALLGIGAAAVASKIPINIPYKGAIAAGVVGGLPGAGAVLLLQSMNGGSADSSSDLVSGY